MAGLPLLVCGCLCRCACRGCTQTSGQCLLQPAEWVAWMRVPKPFCMSVHALTCCCVPIVCWSGAIGRLGGLLGWFGVAS